MSHDPVAHFIARWSDTERAERANKDLFLTELCDLLALPHPDLAATFARGKKEAVAEILTALVVLGRVHRGEKRGTYTP